MVKKTKQKRSMQERELDGFMMEVKDEMRQEKTMEFLKKWGKLFLIIAAVILVSVLAKQISYNQKMKRQYKEAALYEEAISQSVLLNSQKLVSKLEELAKTGKYGYQAVAYFKLADAQIAKNDIEGATEILKEAIKNTDLKDLKHLAILKLAFISVDSWTINQAKEQLQPLLKKSSPFYYSASNLFGFVCMNNGDVAQAKQIFENIVNDENAPVDVKTFSANALSSLK
ncbi:MAG: tetratricopeptide repeat protein [Rickettsiales bacterium]|jgi:hypothetical protein|nr:tetratricopeptide repeat protein [Rickettsiales bacterium]